MKKSIQLTLSILLLSIIYTNHTSAQERTSFNIHKTIDLRNESQISEIKIEMNEEECRFNLKINSMVQGGEVTIEIYDPNKKKQGNFSVGCEIQSDNSKETVNGMITKLIENPELGDWKIKIIPRKATGKVAIQFSQDMIKNTPNN